MRTTEKLKTRIDRLSIRKRLTYSNILMFLIPVAVTVGTTVFMFTIAAWVFRHAYLPRMKPLEEMGEQYEREIRSFLLLVAVLCLLMLALLILSIVVTNRFLTRFMFRRVEEPLRLLTEGVAKVSSGELDYAIHYDRPDEFWPVCKAFNEMATRLRVSAERSATEEQSRRELFAGISHDLRSPLTSVRAYTEALLDGMAKTPEDTRRYLIKIRTHEGEIERMVEALFLYTKMELRDYPVCRQMLDLRTELMRICEEIPTDSGLAVDLSDVLPISVMADPFLLKRVILNLLDNSRKYRRGDIAHVRVTAVRTEHGALMSVADDGTGVPEELLSRLFDPFYRTDPARGNPAGGSGLGLAIVRKAVERLGGKVWAENVPGGGLDVKIEWQGRVDHGEDSDS